MIVSRIQNKFRANNIPFYEIIVNFIGGITMRFREVEKNIEREKLKKEKEEGYKQIKPETNISYKESCEFFDDLFNSMREF